jgi:DNA replication and repair protein RecF
MIGTNFLKTDGESLAHARPLAVASVCLEGFRNYSHQTVILSDGFNVLAGRNAQGKTNFLEALYLLSTTRLLRGQRDAEAILEGRQRASVTAELAGSETRLAIVLEAGIRKRASINGLSIPRASDLIGRLPCVCVSAHDMELVRGEPADRRLFLDLELSALSPAYLRHLTMYKRALEQRNALLRDSREWMQPAETFDPWEEQLATHGAALRNARSRFVERLSPPTIEIHAQMGGGEQVELRMELKDPATDPESLLRALAGTRRHDVARGGTGVGPHRDDLAIDVGGKEAKLYGSQGQQRTAVIAIKLASLQVAKTEFGVPPLLLLDDMLSDLDETRRSLLVDVVLEKAGQAVLTCTEAAAAGSKILDRAKVFHVEAGMVRES